METLGRRPGPRCSHLVWFGFCFSVGMALWSELRERSSPSAPEASLCSRAPTGHENLAEPEDMLPEAVDSQSSTLHLPASAGASHEHLESAHPSVVKVGSEWVAVGVFMKIK